PASGWKTATGVSDTWNRANLWERQTFTTELRWGVRYSQSDPLGIGADLNLYRYAANNPLLKTDPTGLLTCVIFRVNEIIPHAGIWSDGCGGFAYDPGGGFGAGGSRESGIVYGADLCDYLKAVSVDWTSKTISVCFDTEECEECKILENAVEQGDAMPGLCSAASSSCLFGALDGYDPPRAAIAPPVFRKRLIETDGAFGFPLEPGQIPAFCQ
ncbi:MAG: hypothetical protein DRP71_16775, partial [Verrucomicrobia bacterium]